MAEHSAHQQEIGEETLDERLEHEPEPPLRSIAITIGSLCFLLIAGFVFYAVRLNTNPERECADRGGTWDTAKEECFFEGGVKGGVEQVGMKIGTLVLAVPNTEPSAIVTFTDVEVGAPSKELQSYGERAKGGTVTVLGDLGRVEKETQDLIMPFTVSSGGSGHFVYLGVFEKTEGGYTLRDATFAGDRIGTQGVTLSAVSPEHTFFARLLLRERRAGEPMTAVPTEPRTLELLVRAHQIDSSLIVGREGTLYKDLLKVSAPDAHAEVTSPLTITGSARGGWFFEGSFPIQLLDGSGTELAQGVAQAKSDWMTEEFVPFVATLTFTVPLGDTKEGTLIIKKDNPSGLPLHDDQFAIPVIFSR